MMIMDGEWNGHGSQALDESLSLDAIERRAYREAAQVELQHRRGLFASIYSFKGKSKFALECAIAAHGFFEILPVKDFSQLALRWQCSRANVQKLVEKIQKDNGLPPVPGQREEAGCRNMSLARKAQLKNHRNTYAKA